MTPDRAVSLVRRIAQDSSNVVLPMNDSSGQWERTVSDLQAIQCLQNGELVEGPDLDQLKNWRCVFKRFSVGVMVRVTAHIYSSNGCWKVFISEVKWE